MVDVAECYDGWFRPSEVKPLPPVASKRTLTEAICEALIGRYTRTQLNSVLPEELGLRWNRDGDPPERDGTKRELITGYLADHSLEELASLARRLSTYADIYQPHQDLLASVVASYDRVDGVSGKTKNLIFASIGPKPDLVLRDAVNNDVEIVANSDSCLIYDQPLPDGGLTFNHLAAWWAAHPPARPTWIAQASLVIYTSALPGRWRAAQSFSCSGPITHVSTTTPM